VSFVRPALLRRRSTRAGLVATVIPPQELPHRATSLSAVALTNDLYRDKLIVKYFIIEAVDFPKNVVAAPESWQTRSSPCCCV
jgi:hypothetical protein